MNANSNAQEDTVRMIVPEGIADPVGILFEGHAAVYFLYRDDPHFNEWFAVIQESKKTGMHVRFTYVVEGQRLTLVEPVK